MASPQPRSQSCSPSFSRSAPASSQLRISDSEWPFSALRRRRSSLASSRSSSSWPFLGERSPSDTEGELPTWHVDWRYNPVAAKYWVGIYPPVLPPPDFFDLEEEEKNINEKMFKKNNMRENWLYDETGEVNLPADEKGILILDPVSRTKIIDVEVENHILGEYYDWLQSVNAEVEESGAKQSVDWFRGLKEEVWKDCLTVHEEHTIVIDEERMERGLTDWKTHMDWWHSTGHKLAENRGNDNGQCDSTTEGPVTRSESPHSSEVQSVDENIYEDLNVPDGFQSAPQDDEDLPESPCQASPPSELSPNVERTPSPPPLDLVALWW